jgi:hypothetical protein
MANPNKNHDSNYYNDQSAFNYDLNDDPIFSLTQEARIKQIKSFALWGMINVFVFIFILVVVFRFWTLWFNETCIYQLSWWLCGYAYIQGAHIIR